MVYNLHKKGPCPPSTETESIRKIVHKCALIYAVHVWSNSLEKINVVYILGDIHETDDMYYCVSF